MSQRVQVYTIRQGRDAMVGTITFDRELILDPPDDPMLHYVASTPYAPFGEPSRIPSDGLKFLQGLHLAYSGAYLRVSLVEDNV